MSLLNFSPRASIWVKLNTVTVAWFSWRCDDLFRIFRAFTFKLSRCKSWTQWRPVLPRFIQPPMASRTRCENRKALFWLVSSNRSPDLEKKQQNVVRQSTACVHGFTTKSQRANTFSEVLKTCATLTTTERTQDHVASGCQQNEDSAQWGAAVVKCGACDNLLPVCFDLISMGYAYSRSFFSVGLISVSKHGVSDSGECRD